MLVTACAVFQSVGSNVTSQLNSANQNHTLYTRFKEQLITEGIIKWRSHDEFQDVCVITDYSSTTGLFLPQSFVHVTAIKMDDGETSLWPEDDELVPDASLTCLHCHFYRDHLMGMYEKLQMTHANLNMIESTVRYLWMR